MPRGRPLPPPSDKAWVLCVDEKNRNQALNRPQPSLPLNGGRCGTLTHAHKRHDTTSLFATLYQREASVIGTCPPRHRNKHFGKFPQTLDQQIQRDLALRLILDNYGMHAHPPVQEWLANYSRLRVRITPTGSSWLNLAEWWLRESTARRVCRGVFQSVPDSIATIRIPQSGSRTPNVPGESFIRWQWGV